MKNKENIEVLVLRVGGKYLKSSLRVKVLVGQVMTKDLIIKNKKRW